MQPGRVVLLVTAMYWTRDTAAAILAGSLSTHEAACTAGLLQVVGMVRGQLPKLARTTLGERELAVSDREQEQG